MQDVPQRWQSWRIRPVRLLRPAELPPAMQLRATMMDPQTQSPAPSEPIDFRNELPDEQGLRRGFVGHIQQLIAAGHYDAPDRWALAEELLFRRLEEAR